MNATHAGRWRLTGQVPDFTFGGPTTPAGLAALDNRGNRSGPQDEFDGSRNSASYATTWTLTTSGSQIATHTGAPGAWRSLDVFGWPYRVAVDGAEAPGTYATVVTHFLTAA